MSDCPVCVGIPGYESHTCGQANDCDEELIVKSCRRLKDEDNKKYTEAELQEKLRQQREACANTYVEHHIEISPDLGYSIPCEKAILNAKIDD